MKEISIKLAPFVLKQTIFIRQVSQIGEDTLTTIDIPQSQIASFISLQTDLTNVHLFGNQKLAKKIQENCLKKYNVKNVMFTINS